MEANLQTDGDSFVASSHWNLIQFGLVCTYTMGFTGIWKFPYLVYRHTGLFLVAYYILLVLICIPVTFVQLKLGGTLKRGIVGIFSHYLPASKGVAVAILSLGFIQCVYYNVYLGYGLYYMFACLKQPYVWTQTVNSTNKMSANYMHYFDNPVESYYVNLFLQQTSSISSPGTIPWYLGLSLLAAWTLTYCLVCRGAGWFMKLVCVTGPLAILILLATLICGHTAIPTAYQSLGHFFTDQHPATMPRGHTNGIQKNPKDILQSELASPLTWVHAMGQHLFSIGLWAGLLPTLGKHLGNKKPASNLTWLILLLVHSMLPHLGTIAMAPFIHSLAVKRGVPFDRIINFGPTLAFVVLPEAFSTIHISPIWAFLFFMFVVLFAVHQTALLLVVMMENAFECYPQFLKLVFRRHELLSLAVCTFAFLMGLPHITQGGPYLTELVNAYVYKVLFVLVVFSVPPLVLAYVKMEAFNLPIERIFMCIWFGMASAAVVGLLVYDYIVFERQSLGELFKQDWLHYVGWGVAAGPVLLCVVAGVIHALWQAEGQCSQKMKAIFVPLPEELQNVTHNYIESHMNGQLVMPPGSKGAIGRKQQCQGTGTEVRIPLTANGDVANL